MKFLQKLEISFLGKKKQKKTKETKKKTKAKKTMAAVNWNQI